MRLPPLRLAVSVHLVGCGVRSRSGLISTRMCGGPAEDEAYQARFRGNSAIYGEEGQRRLRDSNVCVVGVGGVGSWCVESLARSGVGKITLIDLDSVCSSNINRQIQALTSTVGQNKVDSLRARIADINPACQVSTILDFVSYDTAKDYLLRHEDDGNFHPIFDCVVDCVDSAEDKCAMIALCRDYGIPIVVAGAAGGKADPTAIRVTDITRTDGDPLLARTRKLLRAKHSFPRGTSRNKRGGKWGVAAVFSDEFIQTAATAGERAGLSRCDSQFGTAVFVVGTFGLMAAAIAAHIIAWGEEEWKWSSYTLKSNRGGNDSPAGAVKDTIKASTLSDIANVGASEGATTSSALSEEDLGIFDEELFDAHCHLQMAPEDDVANIIERGTKSGVIAAAICGTFPGSDWDAVARYAAQFPDYIIPSYGLHPWWLNSHLQKGEDGTYLWEDDLRRRLESNQSAGVGECGLDKARRGLPSMDIQADVTLRHLRIAAELWRPCTLHCVRAYGRLLQVIQQLRSEQQEEQNESSPIVLHRFAGDASLVEGFSSLGCYFSISVHELKGPRAEWVEARSRAVAAIPADRLLLESDSPDYGDAQLGRGGDSFSSSSPLDVIHACELVAGIRGLSFHEVAQQTSHNFRHVFPLSAPAAPGKH